MKSQTLKTIDIMTYAYCSTLLGIEHFLTILATLFILFGFSRIAFSIGEHKEKNNTLPTFVFMLVCKMFLLGFILFNIYNHISFYELTYAKPPINTVVFISIFDLLIMLEVVFTNKHLAVIDRYLYADFHKTFDIYWRRTYYPIIIDKNKYLYKFRTALQFLIGSLIFLELFLNLDLHDGFFLILYLFYILTYLMVRSYFISIGRKK